MTDAEIRRVEALVNAEILANAATEARVMPLAEAQKSGAVMLFGEKYGDEVRVLSIGSSKELCGGTHVARTGDIGFFTIVAEGGVAAGVRRVEALTGDNALAYVQGMEQTLGGIAGTLKVVRTEAPARVNALLDQVKRLERELSGLKGKLASAQGDDLVGKAIEVKGVKLLATTLEAADATALRDPTISWLPPRPRARCTASCRAASWPTRPTARSRWAPRPARSRASSPAVRVRRVAASTTSPSWPPTKPNCATARCSLAPTTRSTKTGRLT